MKVREKEEGKWWERRRMKKMVLDELMVEREEERRKKDHGWDDGGRRKIEKKRLKAMKMMGSAETRKKELSFSFFLSFFLSLWKEKKLRGKEKYSHSWDDGWKKKKEWMKKKNIVIDTNIVGNDESTIKRKGTSWLYWDDAEKIRKYTQKKKEGMSEMVVKRKKYENKKKVVLTVNMVGKEEIWKKENTHL